MMPHTNRIENLGEYGKGKSGKDNPNWRGGKYKKCEVCEEEFWVIPSRLEAAKYCSHECGQEAIGFEKGQEAWNKIEPDLTPTPNLSYILGVIEGDSSVFHCDSHRYIIAMETTARKFNLSFEKALEAIKLNPNTYEIKSRKTWRTRANSKAFYDWYNSLDLEKIEEFLSGRRMKEAFVRGFYESEGNISKPNKWCWRVKMECTNKELMKMVHRLLKELDFNFNFGLRENRHGRGDRLLYELESAKKDEVSRFMTDIDPCIKRIRERK